MKITEAFVMRQPRSTVWKLFEDVERVASCVPGVEQVEVLDADTSRLTITQAIGPMTATLDVRLQVTERVAGEAMTFTATGRSVKGAVGNVRASNVVRLEDAGDDRTRVVVTADVALGGMIGSVGQKVVAKQAARITERFAAELEAELNGTRVVAPSPSASTTADATASAPRTDEPAVAEGPRVVLSPAARRELAAAGLGALATGLVVLLLRAVRRSAVRAAVAQGERS